MPRFKRPGKFLRPKHRRNYATGLLSKWISLASGDDAALWAHRSLNEKNKLTAADAQQVEEAFEARLSGTYGCGTITNAGGKSRSTTA